MGVRDDSGFIMRLVGPDRYQLQFTPELFTIRCIKGTNRFSGLATSKLQKLYVISVAEKPIYVGVTKQSMRCRLRIGWKANGKGGYYGYQWRRNFTNANLDMWCLENPANENPLIDIEAIEAEVVYLIRATGQWPVSQTEIHFHPSNKDHRKIARAVAATYGIDTKI